MPHVLRIQFKKPEYFNLFQDNLNKETATLIAYYAESSSTKSLVFSIGKMKKTNELCFEYPLSEIGKNALHEKTFFFILETKMHKLSFVPASNYKFNKNSEVDEYLIDMVRHGAKYDPRFHPQSSSKLEEIIDSVKEQKCVIS